MSGSVLIPAVGALGGAAILGSYTSGAPAMDLITSMSGAAGATIGYVAGKYVASMKQFDSQGSTLKKALPVVGAILVPGLASGVWDKDTLILGVGAWAGAEVISWAYTKYA